MRVLVVEDEKKLSKAIVRALQLQGYAVDTAEDGELAVALAQSESYDVIILDILLPLLDGKAVCRELRTAGVNTPILMLSALGQVNDRTSGLDLGADDYMIKPFSFEELFSRLRALLRRSAQTPFPLLRAEDLVLDPQARTVTRSGQVLELSRKEFALLEYLLRQKNSAVTKEQIVQHVWNYDADILPSTVEVHMKHLRDKVDVGFSPALLVTIRGVGYCLREKGQRV